MKNLITCLLKARDIPFAADVKRIEALLQKLEQAGHAALSTSLRQQLQAKLPNTKKKWWRFGF